MYTIVSELCWKIGCPLHLLGICPGSCVRPWWHMKSFKQGFASILVYSKVDKMYANICNRLIIRCALGESSLRGGRVTSGCSAQGELCGRGGLRPGVFSGATGSHNCFHIVTSVNSTPWSCADSSNKKHRSQKNTASGWSVRFI